MMRERGKRSRSNLEAAIQDTLTSLVEIDRWYDLERKDLDFYPEALRSAVSTEIERRRRLNRQPYVLHLARLHQMLVSARFFGDPEVSLRTRRNGLFSFRGTSNSESQNAEPLRGDTQLTPGLSGSASLTTRRGNPFVSESLSLIDADEK